MYKLNAFIQLSYFNEPTPGTTSAVGEITTYSKTFSKTTNVYQSSAHTGIDLISFDSKLDGTEVTVPQPVTTNVFKLIDWLLGQSVGGYLPDNEETIRQTINNTFSDELTVTSVGELLESKGKQFPSSLTLKIKDGSDNTIQLWISDTHFRNQYPNYELLAVMPLVNMDVLHGSRSEALNAIKSVAIGDITNKVASVANNNPYTVLDSNTYNWVDKNDPTITAPITLSVIIYGAKGQSDDIIKRALVDHILANSSRTRSDWEKILPDLFLPEEFYITPLWNEKSLPNATTKAAVYSPTANIDLQMSYALSTFVGYDNDYVRKNVEHSVMTYRSLSFVALGDVNNRSGVSVFSERWPEFTNLDMKNSLDFNRTSPKTKEFIVRLTKMVTVAEAYPDVTLPPELSVVDRAGIKYISTVLDNVQYLVAVIDTPITPYVNDPNNSIKLQPLYDVYFNAGPSDGDTHTVVAHLGKREVNSNNYGPITENTTVTFSMFIVDDDGILHASAIRRKITVDDGIFNVIDVSNSKWYNMAGAKMIFHYEVDDVNYIGTDTVQGV